MRAAAVGGAAYYAGKKRQEGQDAAELDAAAEDAAAQESAGPTEADIEALKQLAELKEQGVLTAEEFDAQKRKILGT
jgi:ribosomal protein L16 Arg81 hydroxylase